MAHGEWNTNTVGQEESLAHIGAPTTILEVEIESQFRVQRYTGTNSYADDDRSA